MENEKKKLYLRFFENKENQIPENAEQFAPFLHFQQEGDLEFVIDDWMRKHPEGKVDIVWL